MLNLSKVRRKSKRRYATRLVNAGPEGMLARARAAHGHGTVLARIVRLWILDDQVIRVEALGVAAEMRQVLDDWRRHHSPSCVPGQMVQIKGSFLFFSVWPKSLLGGALCDGKANIAVPARSLVSDETTLVRLVCGAALAQKVVVGLGCKTTVHVCDLGLRRVVHDDAAVFCFVQFDDVAFSSLMTWHFFLLPFLCLCLNHLAPQNGMAVLSWWSDLSG